MTDRGGNTDAARVEEREARTGRGSGYAPLEEDRGTSWVSVILGWLAALGAGLILSGIVSGIVGAIFGTAGRQGIAEGGTTAPVGLLVTLPQGAQSSAQQAAPQGLGTILTVSGILALLFPFIGGAIGGAWGASTGRRRP